MTWLGNVEYIEGIEDGIKIHELLETVPQDPEEMAEVRKKALSEPTYVNSLISSDGQSAAIILEMERYPEDGDKLDPKNEIAPVVRKILAGPEFAALNAHVAGGPILHHDYDELAAGETRTFMGLCLLIQMVILLWVGRGVRGVFVPISIVFLSVLWTMGAIGLMGFTLNMMIVILPSLLICVGIGDSMHFIAEYQDQCDKHRQYQAVSRVGSICRSGSRDSPCSHLCSGTVLLFLRHEKECACNKSCQSKKPPRSF
jgi:predicted RND superfamily exporter protein